MFTEPFEDGGGDHAKGLDLKCTNRVLYRPFETVLPNQTASANAAACLVRLPYVP